MMTWDEVKNQFTEAVPVKLKSGSPELLVEDIRTDGMVAVVWFHGTECKRDAFHFSALELA
jgi:uncharacterized protein YodC (DUF2158 family)